jgi:hypothetical protein
MFRWRISAPGGALLHGSGRLEVSTTPTFTQEAIMRFDCGYSPGDCVAHYRWGTTEPHWYDMANSCSDVPPVGNCNGISRTLYWRVRFEPVGGRSYSSPVGVLARAMSTDTVPPQTQAEPGTSPYGQPARVFFWVQEASGTARYVIQLYNGSKVIYGARTDWQHAVGHFETYVDLPIPATIRAGLYHFCVTVVDQADLKASDCAPFAIT